jgi:ABC-type cobalamin/Fe3+-siderophores transport system ATPase subunit
MPFALHIPTNTVPVELNLESGEVLFVLGANGVGKSKLMHRLYAHSRPNARKISAHRQNWFESGSVALTGSQKQSSQTNIGNYDASPTSIWQDAYASERPNVALFDLIDSQNVRARDITAAVDQSDFDLAKTLSKKDAPLTSINDLLRQSNIPITIAVNPGEEITATRSNGDSSYSIAQLSDGEKNALLIACEILNAPTGILMLIDEPERHLHKSIISPLLNNLIKLRSDCAFVISTHDVELCTDNPTAKIILVRSCAHQGGNVAHWEADYLENQEEIDDSWRATIVGGRRRILFVEGNEKKSLDRPLYSVVFSDITIVPMVSCRDVEHAVNGIRNANSLHWIKAWGIVDNDHRTANDIARLKGEGIYALDFYSIESIYYHPEIQLRVARRQTTLLGGNPNELVEKASERAINIIRAHIPRLAAKVTEKEIRERLLGMLPSHTAIAIGNSISIDIDVNEFLQQEIVRLTAALDRHDVLTAISHYPVRETGALNEIVNQLGFQTRGQYEKAVIKLLLDDQDALTFIRGLFEELMADINNT